jgi:hypothetical protein
MKLADAEVFAQNLFRCFCGSSTILDCSDSHRFVEGFRDVLGYRNAVIFATASVEFAKWGVRDIIEGPSLRPRGFRTIVMRKLDSLTTLLLATIFAAFLLFSCAAKQAPREITVKVPASYSGDLTLDPCLPRSSVDVSVDVSVDAKGFAPTSACPKPGETVTLTVVRAGEKVRVPPDQITIERAGDGLPVAIKAHVPVR